MLEEKLKKMEMGVTEIEAGRSLAEGKKIWESKTYQEEHNKRKQSREKIKKKNKIGSMYIYK